MKERDGKFSHLVAISMNRRGFPMGLFTTNRWVTAMLRLSRSQIEALCYTRDAVAADWQRPHPKRDVYKDWHLDIPSPVKVSLGQEIRALQSADRPGIRVWFRGAVCAIHSSTGVCNHGMRVAGQLLEARGFS